jgi:hypothetical protein
VKVKLELHDDAGAVLATFSFTSQRAALIYAASMGIARYKIIDERDEKTSLEEQQSLYSLLSEGSNR